MKNLKLLPLALCLFLYSISSFSRTVLVTDIDDTIKKANSMGGLGGIYHFLRARPYAEIRDLFNEIRDDEFSHGHGIGYYYVSAAPSYTFNAPEWIRKHDFPIGPTYLKTRENGGETYAYKYRTIKAIIEEELKSDSNSTFLFFGDNSQHDANVYFDLRRNLNLNALIFIRDVSTEATFFSVLLPVNRLENVEYFFSERELINNPRFLFMSGNLKKIIIAQYDNESLIPPYTFDTLVDRLKAICDARDVYVYASEDDKSRCGNEAKADAKKYWTDYHHRF